MKTKMPGTARGEIDALRDQAARFRGLAEDARDPALRAILLQLAKGFAAEAELVLPPRA